jgi:antitoxin component of MazEF toxin-antitoxin module
MPAIARKHLDVGPGDELIVELHNGFVVLIPKPEDPVAHMEGLHAEIWADIDPDEYIRQEREAWRD